MRFLHKFPNAKLIIVTCSIYLIVKACNFDKKQKILVNEIQMEVMNHLNGFVQHCSMVSGLHDFTFSESIKIVT